MINQTISHYKILEKLGEGGMGVVYKAEDTKLKRTIALKFLPPEFTRDPEAKERFIQEAQSASSLDHQNICTIYEVGETDEGQIFIAIACYEGITLKQEISNKQLAVNRVIDIAIQIAQGLQRAHEKGIIHRDIKPANIFITNDGTVKILDFGLAKLTGQTVLTKIGSTIGTVAYMSPEQARGEEVDGRTDIWSLGMVIYEMLTRKVAFHAEYEQAIIYKILNEKPEPINTFRKDVPKEIEHIINKALAKDPCDRYQKVDEMLDDMKKVSKQLEVISEERPKSWKRKSLQIIAAIIVLICLAIGIKFLFFPLAETTKQITSIAVLPFQNLSADPEQEYFSDGMTDALITELSKIKALRVISRTSIMRYKKTDKSLPEIAKELKVDAVVEGTVQRVQDLVRINTQLVRAEPEEHLWAKPFTKNITNILELQSEVAQAIANEIKITVTPEEKKQLVISRPVNPEAHEAYLKGRFFINKLNEPDVWKGISYFKQAIAKDSNYALAYEGLAEGYDYLYSFGTMPSKNAFPMTKALARKALSIDETLAEAYAIIGDIEVSEWNWKSAEENFKRAVGLNQNYAIGHTTYAWYLMLMKRYDEALNESKLALEVDPLSLLAKVILGRILFYKHQYDSAMTQIKEVLSIDSNFAYGYANLGDFYSFKGNFKEAIVQYQKWGALGDNYGLAFVAHCYARLGNSMKAREILADLKTKYVPPVFFAWAYIGLGEWDRAFEWLEKAYEKHDPFLSMIITIPHGIDTYFDSFCADPRFHAFVKKMGLEE